MEENFDQDCDEIMDENFEMIPLDNDGPKELAEIVPIDDLEEDYQKTRTNIYELIEKGKEGLEVALNMVSATESPRSIEVFSGLLRILADTNLQLLDIQKKHHEINTSVKKVSTIEKQNDEQTINNGTINQTTIFAGTTAELGKILNEMKKNEHKFDSIKSIN